MLFLPSSSAELSSSAERKEHPLSCPQRCLWQALNQPLWDLGPVWSKIFQPQLLKGCASQEGMARAQAAQLPTKQTDHLLGKEGGTGIMTALLLHGILAWKYEWVTLKSITTLLKIDALFLIGIFFLSYLLTLLHPDEPLELLVHGAVQRLWGDLTR